MKEKDKKGVIKDSKENYEYDSGEALKDTYELADAYEKDKIEVRGIVFFTLGLAVLIGVTFGLMALLQATMEVQKVSEDKQEYSPMAMTKEEKDNGANLPPEPRLQAAPGFGVTTENGDRQNLELQIPQSEYRTLMSDWKKVWKEGRKDPKTGTLITLPMEDAKQKVLEANLPTRSREQAEKAAVEVRLIPSTASAGRGTEIRRQ